MKAWLRDLWGAARLRRDVFAGLSARSDAFWQGFLVIVAVALVAGLPALALDLAGGARSSEPAERAAALSDVRQALSTAAQTLERLGVESEVRERIARGLETSLDIAAGVDALPTALPKPAGALFRTLGAWASRPFADSGFPLAGAALGTWLGYGIWVMLFARLLGGRGTLHGFFGATAMFALPHLLGVFARVPVAGAALGFVAFIWGIAIYLKATAVSHELPFARALLAVALPLAILLLLIALLLPLATAAVVIFMSAVAGF